MKSKWSKTILTGILRRFSTASDSFSLPLTALNSRVRELMLKGHYDQTLLFYKSQLYPFGFHANSYVLPSIIKACSSNNKFHHFGLQLHCIVVKSGSDAYPVVSNSLLSMYAKFCDLESAFKVFDKMPERDNVTWNSIINCFLQNGCFGKSLGLLKEMWVCGFVPKPELLASVVSVCCRMGNVRLGKVIHGVVVVDGGIEENVLLDTALIDLYMRGGDVDMAVRVFERMTVRNEVSWTAMVSGFVGNGNYDMAIEWFRAMRVAGVKPNRVTLVAVLPAFAEFGGVEYVKEMHGYAVRRMIDQDHHFNTSLVHAYCKYQESIDRAKLIFDKSRVRDIVMWSSIVGGYSGIGDGSEAMKLFSQMRKEGIQPNSVTLLAILSCCVGLSLLDHGRGIHGYALKSGSMLNVSIGNSLINMYSKCGCLPAACQIFKEMPLKDSISWSTLISGYGLHGLGLEALEVFHEMQEEGIEPDDITFISVLSACNHAGLVEEGQKLFDEAMNCNKIQRSVEHYACYIDLLGRSGKLEDACEVIRRMPMKPSAKVWTSLVSACKAQDRLDVAEILAPCLIKSEPRNAANFTLLSMIRAESGNTFDAEKIRRFLKAHKMGKCVGFSQI